MKVLGRVICAAAVFLVGITSSYAGITINGTRVVYPAEQREVSLSMVNDGKETRLVQAWIDAGDAGERPDTTKAPFVITPPMSRVDPGKGQTLRIMFTGARLPQDRETLFYLNVLEIPPKPKAGVDGENYLQVAIKSRIKLFYRPRDLPGTPDAAVDQVNWHVVQKSDGYTAECVNNTAYNVSISDATFKGSPPLQASGQGGTCPAKGKLTIPVAGHPDASNKMLVTVVNDFGGFNAREVNYSR